MKRPKNKPIKIFFSTLIVTLIGATFFLSYPIKTMASAINPENLLFLINQNRKENRLSPLKINSDLNQAANFKSKDMLNRNYFDHYYRGISPWDFIRNSGYDYLYAGENLAMDFRTAEGMVSAWMNSKTHRENILNPDFTDVGIGVIKGNYIENGTARNTTIVTNMFGQKKPRIVKIFNYLSQNILNLF